MVLRALSADLLKLRRRGVWFLVLLGSLGLVALQALNFGLRYDYLVRHLYKEDAWGGLIGEIVDFVPIALVLGVTLIASQIANVEHLNNSWKQLLALPISRAAVFTSKYLVGVIALTVACVLLFAGTIGLGLAFGFGAEHIPYLKILKLAFFPFLGALPMLALQLYLSLTFKNQALPIMIGITAAIATIFAGNYPDFLPLAWPFLAYYAKPAVPVASGIVLFIIIYLLGTGHFARKDVD
ncbi:ABC transporter permease subunit [Paenibacillus sp. HJL G12]|uniref:ABC transporter permease subunit n=1 Tax=Paenibacillus dendrobii TaxID=2691084 RepID=A0A7X3INE7_9BACL|nr:ABC transporter permease [Paenibacillus dendrobii]MWV45855.1 ABC transporter permease subunit [Paenibacillus dendrobii]